MIADLRPCNTRPDSLYDAGSFMAQQKRKAARAIGSLLNTEIRMADTRGDDPH
jgi:hypothetical protein